MGVLYVAAALFGVSIGSAMTAAYTSGGSVLPGDSRGAGFGVLTSASLAGIAISPMLAGLLAGVSMRAVFVCDAVALLLVALSVTRLMASRSMPTAMPAAEEV
jgi:MFS family permease